MCKLVLFPFRLAACRSRAAGLAAVLGLIAAVVPAAAETVTGTLRYALGDDLRPIAGAEVEIWRKAPGRFGFSSWRVVESARTDDDGIFSVDIPFAAPEAVYSVVVFARNDFASVWPSDQMQGGPLHAEPGFPEAPLRQVVSGPDDVIVFDHDFRDEWVAQHFDLADTLRLAGLYAKSKRVPTAQPVSEANVTVVTGGRSVGINPVPMPGVLMIDSGILGQRALIAREYAHFLQATLGSLKWQPSISNGCAIVDLRGRMIDSPELAWSLGFANYFAVAVAADNPHMALHSSELLDLASECPPSGQSAPGDRQVAAALWDLAQSTDGGAGQDDSVPADHLLFSIIETGQTEPWLTMDAFREAWTLRGGDDASLDAILLARGFRQPSEISSALATKERAAAFD